MEKLSTSDVISQKPHGGGKHHSLVLLGLNNLKISYETCI